MTVPVSELQAVAPSAIIEIFELALQANLHGSSDIWRFHSGSNTNNNGAVIWNGQSYMRYPIEFEGVEYSGQGTLPQPKLRISNIMGSITALLLAANSTTPGNDLIGAKLTRIRTLAKFIDAANFPDGVNPTANPTVEFPREIYYLSQKSAENRDVVEFICSSSFDLQGVRAPKRQCISNICQWNYRSSECGYTEAAYYDANDNPVFSSSQDVCGKRLSSCKARFGSVRKTGSLTFSSVTMTLSSTAGLSVGQPIFGFGVPTGVTITAIPTSTALTMSAAATASTSVTVSATPSSTAATIAVTSATGLAAGQSVTGSYIPDGTSVISISGTTVTLNQRPYSVSRSGTWNFAWNRASSYPYYWQASQSISIDTTGISTGMQVWGSNGISTTVSGVGSGYITLNSYGSLSGPSQPRFPIPLSNQATTASSAVNLFFIPASPASASYSFAGSNLMTFRTTDGILNFGSFPAVGLYG
jgi:lambda family phage minor tail protein L